MKHRITWVWYDSPSVLFVLSTSAPAQSYRARITGLVSDASEASIAGANVTLVNVNTGVRVVRQTSETVLYVFDLVDPGTYIITVEFEGFNN